MASTSHWVFCVLLLAALAACQAVASRPLADEPSLEFQIVLIRTLVDATRLSGEVRTKAADIDNDRPVDVSTRIVASLLNDLVAVISEFNDKYAALDADRKLTPIEDNDDEGLVPRYLTQFKEAHQAALDTLIGTHEFLSFFPHWAERIRVSLVSVERVVGIFASYVICVMPIQKAAVEEQFGSLNKALAQAVSTFNPSESGFADHQTLLKMKLG